MTSLRGLVVVVALAGCTFDSSGLGVAGESGGTEGTSTTTGETDATSSSSDGTTTSDGTTVASVTADVTTDVTAGPTSEATTASTTTDATQGTTTTDASTSTTGCDAMHDYYPDNDMDGFGAGDPVTACSAPPGTSPYDGDCDDGDPKVHPGADELCDGSKVDENCNGLINEYSPMNETCGMCTQAYFSNTDHYYWFCKAQVDWDVARQACMTVGADLVSIGGDGEDGFVRGLTGAVSAWLGGRDFDPNNDKAYVWVDGTSLTYTHWVQGQPNDNNGCIFMPDDDDGEWRDAGCKSITIGYVCEAGVP